MKTSGNLKRSVRPRLSFVNSSEFGCNWSPSSTILRYGSLYLEQTNVLEFTQLELYWRFWVGKTKWVVHDRPWWFCTVWGDMKIEQTIQRVSTGPGGYYVVGATRNAIAMVEWVRAIVLLNFLTSNNLMNHTECHLQHALSTIRHLTFNRNVSKLLDFVLKWQSQYSVTVNVPVPPYMHNLLTKVVIDRTVTACLLNFHKLHPFAKC